MSKDYTIKPCGNQFCLYTADQTKLLGRHPTQAAAQEQESLIQRAKAGGSAYSLPGVEIFKIGEHNGDVYDAKDLQDMVDAAKGLDFLPAIKLGHARQSGAPAYGYVNDVRMEGDALVGDFTDMPKDVYDAVLQRRYGRVSSEVHWNLKRDGKTYRRAVSAVALLGQEIPGVAKLKPLYQTFEMEGERALNYEADIEYAQSAAAKSSEGSDSRKAATDKGQAMPDGSFPIVTLGDLKNAIQSFGRANNPDAVKAHIKKRAETLGAMDMLPADWKKSNMALDELVSAVQSLAAKVEEFAKGKALSDTTAGGDQRSKQASMEASTMADNANAEQINKLTQQIADLSGKVSDSDTKLKSYEQENTRLRAYQREQTIKEKSGKVTLPAFKPIIAALYDAVLDNESKVKLYSIDSKTSEELSPIAIVDKLVEHLNNTTINKLFKQLSGNDDKKTGEYDDAGAEATRRANDAVTKKEYSSFADAFEGVLKQDPELSAAYMAQRAN